MTTELHPDDCEDLGLRLRISVPISPDLLTLVRAAAFRDGRTVAGFVRQVLVERLRGDGG